MSFNMNKMLFMIMLMMSIIIVISSENWISLWMGMEMNMMMFMAIIAKKYNNKSSESMMIYFLIQSMGSMIFIYSIFMNKMCMLMTNMNINMYYFIMLMSIMLKIGTAPFHFWLISMMSKMSWDNNLILMTLQKIIPMIIIQIITNNYIIFIVIMSVIVGAIGGINQSSIKKMMGYSSINHMGWMMMSTLIENEMWFKYFIIYSMMTVFMVKMFKEMMIMHMNQLNMITNKMMKINMIIMMMSMGGLPPLIGFFPKWMIINKLINMNLIMPTLIMIMCSMLTLYYYIRITIPFMMMKSMNNKWASFYSNKLIYMTSMNMILPIIMMTI
uniref:NADH-ubiquinone oxidoreductase chain 2 n=1 Tax=Hydrometra greeni TaxID=1492928 RepID=C5HIN7_9HEMI|nr:NADH dehydrogenase subunit 2 [Hydrometra greeni]ACJ69482.1 NADH dehydrogenase subunit 2 [Hydrometra greeni]